MIIIDNAVCCVKRCIIVARNVDYTILKWLAETRMCVDWTQLAQDPVNVLEPS
jgi:hypothetical protein